MLKRLCILALAFAGTPALASASQPACPALIIVVPQALQYPVQPCIPLPAGLTAVAGQCLNCPGETSHIINRTHPVCVLTFRGYDHAVIERHLANGKCVPDSDISLFGAPRAPVEVHPAPPAPAAAPPRVAPIAAPAPHAPPLAGPQIASPPVGAMMQTTRIAPAPAPARVIHR
ncbi:MAG TPA: hypothetical protein VIO32_04355 [Candidatus Baltobacteraceae bacterium]